MAEPIKLLLIEDNIADARFIEILLREITTQRYIVEKKTTFREGSEYLLSNHADLLILDLSLPDSMGLETIQNANEIAPQIPIIVLTGRNDDDFAVIVVEAGAQDYLVKGEITSTLLSRSIRYAIRRKLMEVDLKNAKKGIEESETKLNTIITYNRSGIIVLNRENEIKFINPAAEALLHGAGHSFLGKKFFHAWSLSIPTLVKGGPDHNMLIEILAVETNWGGEDSILLTLHNITDLKKAEENLRLKNHELMRINTALDKFVYIISHDLKRPVANILGLLNLFENEISAVSEKSVLIFQKLKLSGLQLKKMIEDLLESTKREAASNQNYEIIDFQTIYSEVIAEIETVATPTNVNISFDFSKCALINYSFQDLKSILTNLLSNAVKYLSKERDGTISVTSSLSDGHPVLTVADNGIGMDMEEIGDKLFKKYQRFNTEAEGTGLGLWIVKETVEKNGGEIKVESALNKGTTFQVIF